MTHDEAGELLGAYALDAVEGDEVTELEDHLETCPRCRAELDTLRDVAAAMGNSVEAPPEGLWSQIAVRLPGKEEDDGPPPMPRLAGEPGSPFRAPPAHDAVPAHRRSRSRSRVVVTSLGTVAVAAAAAAIVLGIGLVRADDNAANLHSGQSAQAARSAAVAAALRAPGHQVVTLDAGSGSGGQPARAEVVLLRSGQGYLVSSTLPALGRGRTYQLWAIEGSQPISLGLLGGSPGPAAFVMAGSTQPSHLSITAEPAGGSVFPTGPVVVTSTV